MKPLVTLILLLMQFDFTKTGFGYRKSHTDDNGVSDLFNAMDSILYQGGNTWLQVITKTGEPILKGYVQGKFTSYIKQTDAAIFKLQSLSKVVTATAAMISFQKKPDAFYPEKAICELPGWESMEEITGPNGDRVRITLHQLLTHTSGLRFEYWGTKDEFLNSKYNVKTTVFEPGTKYGYSNGHRIVGWILYDFWRQQPESKDLNFKSDFDVFKWLLFDPLNMTQTFHVESGDSSITSSGDDMSKLAQFGLNKGKLPDGRRLISEENWEKWAMKNLLPDGKRSEELVGWSEKFWEQKIPGTSINVMQRKGVYGWNYFGAIYEDDNRLMIGWCGALSSCLHIHYTLEVAIVRMNDDFFDLSKSKVYLQNAAKIASFVNELICRGQNNGVSRCVMCQKGAGIKEKDETCPLKVERWKSAVKQDILFDTEHHVCFNPKVCRPNGKNREDETENSFSESKADKYDVLL